MKVPSPLASAFPSYILSVFLLLYLSCYPLIQVSSLPSRILDIWAEYISELFEDYRNDYSKMKHNFAGPPIMKDEIRAALRKETDPNSISVELLKALEDYGIDMITTLLNEIYDTGQVPLDMSKSIFIALPKKPRATGCELHIKISLMSIITKILLRIIMMRFRNKIKPEKEKGSTNDLLCNLNHSNELWKYKKRSVLH